MLSSRPLVVGATAIYGAFALISLVSLVAKMSIGSQLILAWPYPFLLSFQEWIPAAGTLSFVLAYVLGLAVVFGVAASIQRWVGPGRPRGAILLIASLVLSYAPLFALQAVVRMVLPNGE